MQEQSKSPTQLSQENHDSAYKATIGKLVLDYLDVFQNEGERLEQLLSFLKQNADYTSRKNFVGHLTGSALLLDGQEQSCLLIYHNFLQIWIQPGGHLDPEEHPYDGARRECMEEIGLTNIEPIIWNNDKILPLDIDTHPIPENPSKQEDSHFHHDFLYLFKLPEEATFNKIALQTDEVTAFRSFSLEELRHFDSSDKLKRAADKIIKLRMQGII